MPLTTGVTRGGLIAAALALGGVLAAVGSSGGAMFSPGGLRAGGDSAAALGGVTSHAALAGRCTACHASLGAGETMNAKCLSCHGDIRSELGDSTALHGGLANARLCLACHTEHGGPTASLVRSGAGAADHERLGFSLVAHQRTHEGRGFLCGDCHGGGSFRFDPGRCENCHRSYQAPFMAEHLKAWGSHCMACHEGTDRFSPGRFSHDSTRFALTGAHERLECARCHQGARAVADLGTASRECVGCHRTDDVHRGEFGADCRACHATVAWKPTSFRHSFPIAHGRRGSVACRACHEPGRKFSEYTCYGCHEHTPERIAGKHSEEGISGARLDDCVRCHATGREKEGEGREGDGGAHGERGDDD